MRLASDDSQEMVVLGLNLVTFSSFLFPSNHADCNDRHLTFSEGTLLRKDGDGAGVAEEWLFWLDLCKRGFGGGKGR